MANASSLDSESRARLIREMSRDLNGTRRSMGSSRNSQGFASVESTISNFDPENEALMSTRQLDTFSVKLPELRASAQKYNRFARQERSEPDFAINTSALGRAFPDFSSGGTSDGSSMSIEIGRGFKKSGNGTASKLRYSGDHIANSPASVSEDSLDFKAPIVGSYQVVSTPPIRQRSIPRKKDDSSALRREAHVRSASLNRKEQLELAKKTSQEILKNRKEQQKENMNPSPPLAKTTDYVSSGSGHRSGEERRTLSAMHARVRDEDEMSKLNDERPPTIDLTTRSTRFGSVKNQPASMPEAMPTKFSSAKDFMRSTTSKNVGSQHKGESQAKDTVSSTPNHGTQQSFMLPDMPNLSELVSGVYQDGTPVFSRHNRSRASRFASSSEAREKTAKGSGHAAVGDIPIPDDENAIFISLRLLQDKVGDLEKDRAQTQNMIQDLQQKNQTLEAEKAERRKHQRSDSALGSSDSGSDSGPRMDSNRKLIIEKNRLASSARMLQSQLDATDRRASTLETVVNNMTKERDSAVSQLGVAYFTIEQLKRENNDLATDNQELRIQINHLHTDHENETLEWTTKENDLRRKIQQAKYSVRNLEEMSQDMFNGRRRSTKLAAGKANWNVAEHSTSQRLDAQPYLRVQKRSKDADRTQARTTTDSAKASDSRERDTFPGSRTNQKTKDLLRGIAPAEIEDTRNSQDSDEFLEIAREEEELSKRSTPKPRPTSSRSTKHIQGDDSSQDLTYLSFLKSDEVGKLRKTLELERKARKEQRASIPARSTAQDDVAQKTTVEVRAPLPRKSSMKDVTWRSSSQKDKFEQLPQESNSTQEVPRPKSSGGELKSSHCEPSAPVTRRRARSVGMTSPFIIPDITIETLGLVSQPPPELSRARQDFTQDKRHDPLQCTICSSIMKHGIDHEHKETAKENIKIPKPVPASERMPAVKQYEEEPTIRPSQPPALALASVLKSLSDEHAHLLIQYTHIKSLYLLHDPAIMKTKRKDLCEKMTSLLNAMELKADQIYSLHDVLEGQTPDGKIDINDQDVEETLQSIGIDLVELGLRGGEAPTQEQTQKSVPRQPWDLESNENSTQDLPWEGIETTVETSKSGQTGTRRRSWAT